MEKMVNAATIMCNISENSPEWYLLDSIFQAMAGEPLREFCNNNDAWNWTVYRIMKHAVSEIEER